MTTDPDHFPAFATFEEACSMTQHDCGAAEARAMRGKMPGLHAHCSRVEAATAFGGASTPSRATSPRARHGDALMDAFRATEQKSA